MKLKTIVVTRHAATVEWLKEWLKQCGVEDWDCEVIQHVTDPAQVRGKVVIGNLPLHLAALAEEVWAVEMPGLRLDQRGRDLTIEEMDAAGAAVVRYRVARLS